MGGKSIITKQQAESAYISLGDNDYNIDIDREDPNAKELEERFLRAYGKIVRERELYEASVKAALHEEFLLDIMGTIMPFEEYYKNHDIWCEWCGFPYSVSQLYDLKSNGRSFSFKCTADRCGRRSLVPDIK